jgi:phage major head subunit gpT-like protein
MLVTPAAIAALNVGFNNLFQQGWDSTEVFWPKLAVNIPSVTLSQVHGAMQRLPVMREWLGPRVFANVLGHAQTIVNRHFELSVQVNRDQIEDDMLGWTNPMFQEMGRQGAKWPDQLLVTQIQNNPVGFDALAFFNANHPLDPIGGVQSNLLATALTPANYAAAREAMMAFTGEDGEPMGVMPNLLVVPPQLEREGRTILQADIIPDPGAVAAGVSNIYKGSADLLVLGELANEPTAWYLFDTSRPMKPWIWQTRKPIEMAARTEVTDDNVFNLNQFEWGIDGRGEVGPGPWFLGLQGNV